MLNKLFPGVSFCKTNFLECCDAQSFSSEEYKKVSWWLMLFLSHCQVVSMQMDVLHCNWHICLSNHDWTNPITAQAIFLLSEKS